MTRPFATLEHTVRVTEAAIAAGDLEAGLRAIRSQFEAWNAVPELTRNAIWGSRELDALAARIGGLIAAHGTLPADAAWPERDGSQPLDLYLFTRTEIGGHVRVAGDLVRAGSGRTSVVVLAEEPAVPIPPDVAERFATPAERIICLPPSSLLGTTRALLAILTRLRPDRVFVFNHHHDAATVSAAAAWASAHETYYVHHGDFSPALGVFMPDAAHVDLTPRAHAFCTTVLGLTSTYVPLVAEDRGRRTMAGRAGAPPVIATCGGASKYDVTYRIPYHEVVGDVLAATGATMYHLGWLSVEQLAAVRAAIGARGVDPERWRYVVSVASVWDTMEELGVDLYVNSFPQRGARVAVEVMGSATPAVWHLGSERHRSAELHVAYPEAVAWADPRELIAIVNGLDATWIEQQSTAARRHYERAHHPSLLRAIVASGFTQAPPPQGPRARLFAFEFEHLERSWHRLTERMPPGEDER